MSRAKADPRHQRLRDALIEARKSKGLTQIDLAAKLGKTQIWVSRFERGPRELGVVEFLDIAKAIGVDPCRTLRKLKT